MTPEEIYREVSAFSGQPPTIICDLHSACSPGKKQGYLCGHPGSKTPVIDFDNVKTQADRIRGLESRKSVDALAVSPSRVFLCFIELKSWELLLRFSGKDSKIRKQATKYTSDLPIKLSDSVMICEEITGASGTFNESRVMYVLLTDISVDEDGIMALSSDLDALAGTSSNLKELCNTLSKGVMDGITTVETRYWECRSFDRNMMTL